MAFSEYSAQISAPARAKRTRKLILLGASGSIGSSTLSILPESGIELVAVSVHGKADRLAEIISKFPTIRYAAITDPEMAQGLARLSASFPSVQFFSGSNGLVELVRLGAQAGADTVLTAVMGSAGIAPTLKAIQIGLKIALANKETLVTAGPVIENALALSRACIVPVDSEHNALFQLLLGVEPEHLRRAILTASGGPFLSKSKADVEKVSRDEVLNHPTWSMGPKITVDSAGLINKGLEIIEAHHLFGIPYSQLDVLIHPVSHVHAMVETPDGYRMMASRPTMVFPIAHALYYPDPVPELGIATRPESWPPLEFRTVDTEQFPGFRLCMEAARAGGTAPAVLNASNEVAAGLFLSGLIQFTAIPHLIELALDRIPVQKGTETGLYLEADARARALTSEMAREL